MKFVLRVHTVVFALASFVFRRNIWNVEVQSSTAELKFLLLSATQLSVQHYLDIYTVSQKNRTPVTFSNNSNNTINKFWYKESSINGHLIAIVIL